jgi:hypothetical protein
MKAYKVTIDQMESALRTINAKYESNVMWKRFEPNGSGVNFTLTVRKSTDKGGRLGQCLTSKGNRRHIAAACWHVHGDFFDALFDVAPNAYVRSNGGSLKITKDEGNWQDRNIGSQMHPLYYSEACDC